MFIQIYEFENNRVLCQDGGKFAPFAVETLICKVSNLRYFINIVTLGTADHPIYRYTNCKWARVCITESPLVSSSRNRDRDEQSRSSNVVSRALSTPG